MAEYGHDAGRGAGAASGEFVAVGELLDETRRFLHEPWAGVRLAERAGAGCQRRLEHAGDRLQALRAERPARVTALVLGEFKAGKSTLINALVGRPVAAVDVFEMTHAVCRVVPAPPGTERVELTTGDEAAPPARWTLPEFLARCEARTLGPYTQATLYVPAALDLVLVDTPGLGATLEHEREALDAVSTADVVLCALDAGSLGGGRDAATLQRLGELGLPLLCILTKTDLLAPGETEEAVEYVQRELGVPASLIFPVTVGGDRAGEPDPGLARLRAHLMTGVAPARAFLRERALLAQAADVASELGLCVEEVARSSGAALRELRAYREALLRTAEAVTVDLCLTIAEMLRDRLKLALEEPLLARARRGARLSEADFTRAFGEAFAEIDNRAFLEALQQGLEVRFQREWVEGIRAHTALLQAQLEELRREVDGEAAAVYQSILDQGKQKEAALESAVGGVAVLVSTTLVGGPLFLGALAAAPFLYKAWVHWSEVSAAEALEAEFREAVAEWRERAIG
ncbi:MAG TPA: dynamin family protein, partial [Armatimonadota bacterium]|nr:dynamin family protein [Armatimonadota bacterium]